MWVENHDASKEQVWGILLQWLCEIRRKWHVRTRAGRMSKKKNKKIAIRRRFALNGAQHLQFYGAVLIAEDWKIGQPGAFWSFGSPILIPSHPIWDHHKDPPLLFVSFHADSHSSPSSPPLFFFLTTTTSCLAPSLKLVGSNHHPNG